MNLPSMVFAANLLFASGFADAQATVSRYVLLHQGEEVLDTQTNLVWRRCAVGVELAHDRCIGDSSKYDISVLPVRDTPWRLPTQAELLSLVVQPVTASDQAKARIDETVFPDTPRARFQAAGAVGGTYPNVDFSTGRPGWTRPLAHYPIRAIRDMPVNSLPRDR